MAKFAIPPVPTEESSDPPVELEVDSAPEDDVEGADDGPEG